MEKSNYEYKLWLTKENVINVMNVSNNVYKLSKKKGNQNMNTQSKIYITASELAESLGISMGQAYKIIRNLNNELAKDGYITVAGKCPRRYLEEKWYGYGAQVKQ